MKKIFILFIKGYQKFISPLKPPCCRFYPTCSAYAVQAFQKFGVFRGLWLAFYRLIRCNPWNIGGIDYVPDEFHFFKHKNK
ncbi:MAG: membrane protein insertion efficiency factor YidD [Clostridiales bacterium]|nr:membrane protein insertion efficiency factor YidD [Clostridiales bacterium]